MFAEGSADEERSAGVGGRGLGMWEVGNCGSGGWRVNWLEWASFTDSFWGWRGGGYCLDTSGGQCLAVFQRGGQNTPSLADRQSRIGNTGGGRGRGEEREGGREGGREEGGEITVPWDCENVGGAVMGVRTHGRLLTALLRKTAEEDVINFTSVKFEHNLDKLEHLFASNLHHTEQRFFFFPVCTI